MLDGWFLLTLAFVLLVSTFRLAFLLLDCPFDLSPDEAHYWDWSRRLDWSYYSKGPLVAWLIRASCELFSSLAVSVAGNAMPAVRFPAVFLGALTLVGLHALTVQVYGCGKAAFCVVVAAACSPLFAAGGLLMTIDAPYACCWTWALVLAHRLLFTDNDQTAAAGWACLGLVVGLGILAKYNMVLFILFLGMFLLADPTGRRRLASVGFWIMSGVAAACCLPILVWNARHDWVTFRHVGRQSGVSSAEGWNFLGPADYLVSQGGVLLGVGLVLWVAAMVGSWRERHILPRRQAEQEAFLRWFSVPMFLFFLVFSVKTKVEPNWPFTAYLSGLVLTAGWLRRRSGGAAGRAWRTAAIAVVLLGLGVSALAYSSQAVYPLAPMSDDPTFLRRLDPTCRLRGWQALAAYVDGRRAALRERGEEPVLAATGWSGCGVLSFYLSDQAQVFSLGLAGEGRHSQYDLWRPTPVHDPAVFLGRSFILVGPIQAGVQAGFDEVGATEVVTYYVNGRAVARWQVTVCRGFRGFGGARSPVY